NLSDSSKCADWNRASGDARQAYAGQVYERVRRFASRLNVEEYIVQSNIARACKATPGARLGAVKSSCERYITDCKPIREPPYLVGGHAQKDIEVAQNVDV